MRTLYKTVAKMAVSMAIVGAVTMGLSTSDNSVIANVAGSTAEAQQYWCHNDGMYDYYVDDSIGITRSNLHYVKVFRSDGAGYKYVFDNWPHEGWNYNFSYGADGTGTSVYRAMQLVSTNPLANDILYVTLQLTDQK